MEKTSVLALLPDNKASNATASTTLSRIRFFTASSLRPGCAAHSHFRGADLPAVPIGIERPIAAGQRVHLQQLGQLRIVQPQAHRRNIVAFPLYPLRPLRDIAFRSEEHTS